MAQSPVLIAACGNADVALDAFGPKVAAALSSAPPDGAEVLNLGASPSTLLDHLCGRAALALVDAALAAPAMHGRLIQTSWFSPDRPALVHDRAVSTHGLGLDRQLALAEQLGLLPDTVWLVALCLDPQRADQVTEDWLEPRVQEASEQLRAWARERARPGGWG